VSQVPIRRCPFCKRTPFGAIDLVQVEDGNFYTACKPPCGQRVHATKEIEKLTMEREKAEIPKKSASGDDADLVMSGSTGSRGSEPVSRTKPRRW
jgi:hypothetical protein